MSKTRYKLALLAGLMILAGCAQQPATKAEAWLTPEPLQVPYRNELAIARLSEILQRAELTEAQSAQLFYDRGVMYDSVGLRSLARLDFMRALRLKPDMPEVYNLLGIHYTLSGNFSEAYEAFDSTLELAPDYDFAYLNRAIAFYYAGRFDLAEADFDTFYQVKPSDPYRVLWRYIGFAERDAKQAQAVLQQHLLALDADDWATNLVRFYAGELSEKALLESILVGLNNPRQLAERLCEAYFYLAKWHQARGDANQALIYYHKTLATNVYEFVEHRYARMEMAKLRGDELSNEQHDFE
ncbi:lipoprotein NlpI [Alishewanella agri BL06]|uniref:Lipoprotein NlpI n=2 Tax=Alteromonadaceae TaxID=72275 RepID=I9NZK1_9ALTE|nr:lipoprotein NlpI [Alishewanella agri BL06]KRS22432.1 lipoprotein NlpI [Alishewanella sp. WH16-1]